MSVKYNSRIGFIVACSFAGPRIVSAADLQVDTSWTFDQINAILDGNPNTLGKDGHPDAQPGDVVNFASGVYQLPMIQGATFIAQIPNVHLRGQGFDTTLRGVETSSGAVVAVFSVGVHVSNFTFENAQHGCVCAGDLDPASPIVIAGCRFRMLDLAIRWDNYSIVGDNTHPSLIVTDNHFDSVPFGILYNSQSDPTSFETAWAQVVNNTFEGIQLLAYQLPRVCPTGTGCTDQEIACLGLPEFDGNVVVDSDGAVLNDVCFSGVGWPIGASNLRGVSDLPDSNGEWEDCLDPNPSYPCVSTLAAAWGGHNFVDNPLLNWARRPLPGSPLVGQHYVQPDGTPRGYGGANAPFGDWDGDGKLSQPDYQRMLDVLTGPCPNPPTPCAALGDRLVFDANGDGDIDDDDVSTFLSGADTSVIPATSTWTLAVLALLIVIAVTLVLGRRSAREWGSLPVDSA